jgi:hypothetical protein
MAEQVTHAPANKKESGIRKRIATYDPIRDMVQVSNTFNLATCEREFSIQN